MPSRIKYLSVTFLEDVMIGAMLLATGTTVSLPDDLARGLGNSVQINGPGSAAGAVVPGGGGSGTVKTVNSQNPDGSGNVALTAAQVNALGIPLSWNAATNTPTLTAGVAPTSDNTYEVSGAPTATAVSLGPNVTSVINGDIIFFDGTNYQKIGNATLPISAGALPTVDTSGNVITAVPGVNYRPGYLVNTGVPIGVPSSGTIGANGALSGITSFIAIYSSGIWLYFPAGAVYAASPAGFYWTVMGTVNTGTVNANFIATTLNTPFGAVGNYLAPTTVTPLSGTTGSAYTSPSGATANVYVPACVVPANAMGKNGSITSKLAISFNNSANNKQAFLFFGAMSINTPAGSTATKTANSSTVYNRGVANSQIAIGPSDSAGNSQTLGTVDTTANVYPQVGLKLNTAATDWVVLETLQIALDPQP